MIEDGIQEVWRRLTGGDKGESTGPGKKVPLWQRLLGFSWVVAWLLITAPWYLYPTIRLPTDIKWMVPFSVAENVGMHVAQTLLVVGGLLLKLTVGGEL